MTINILCIIICLFTFDCISINIIYCKQILIYCHVNLDQFSNQEWPCPQNCGRSYKHKHSLTNHLKYECGVQPQFICKNCSRTFKLKHHLKKHKMSCDNIPPEFCCPICNKFFRQKWDLKTHMGCVHKVINI